MRYKKKRLIFQIHLNYVPLSMVGNTLSGAEILFEDLQNSLENIKTHQILDVWLNIYSISAVTENVTGNYNGIMKKCNPCFTIAEM